MRLLASSGDVAGVDGRGRGCDGADVVVDLSCDVALEAGWPGAHEMLREVRPSQNAIACVLAVTPAQVEVVSVHTGRGGGARIALPIADLESITVYGRGARPALPMGLRRAASVGETRLTTMDRRTALFVGLTPDAMCTAFNGISARR